MRRQTRLVLAIAATCAIAAATAAIVIAYARPDAPDAHDCPVDPEPVGVAVPAPPAPPPPPPPRPPFDLLACATDLAPGPLAPERRGPPPAAMHIRLHARRELDAAARAIAAALPHRWHAHVELDATGMAKSVELHLDGARAPSASATMLLDLVRAHPCLFGVLAPAELTATGDGDVEHQGVRFDVRSPDPGNLYASLDSEGHAYHVVIEQHLWPVAGVMPAIDPTRMLARYVGRTYGAQTGTRYLIDPRTRQHTACVPVVGDRVAVLEAFRWHAGPLLACRGDHADVVYGARVDVRGAMRRDAVLAELPAALLPDGTPVAAPYVAPAVVDVEGVDFLHDLGECPSPP